MSKIHFVKIAFKWTIKLYGALFVDNILGYIVKKSVLEGFLKILLHGKNGFLNADFYRPRQYGMVFKKERSYE